MIAPLSQGTLPVSYKAWLYGATSTTSLSSYVPLPQSFHNILIKNQFLGAKQLSLLSSALSTMSAGAFIAPSAIIASLTIKRTKRFLPILIAGWILLALGMYANTTMHPSASKALIFAPRCIAAVGSGLLMPTPLFAVQVKQLEGDIGIATSTQIFARSLGTAFGVAMGGVVFQNRWGQLITSYVKEGVVSKELVLGSNEAELGYGIVRQMPEQLQSVYKGLYADSLCMVWWVMLGICGVGLLGAAVGRNEVLRGMEHGNRGFDNGKAIGDEEM